MRFKTLHFVSLAFLIFLPSIAFPWGSLVPGETHQYIINTAYNRLKEDPAFATNLFPIFSAIKGHEGVQWTADGLFGVGPDGKGMSNYSEHYYNPSTGEGNGPKAAARYYSYLVRENIVGKVSSEAGAKAAAYSAHFLADMFVPYHVVGMSRGKADKIWVEQTAIHPGVINLGTSITGSPKLSYWTPFKGGNQNFNTELIRFVNSTEPPEADWFDPWYFNGNTETMMIKTSSHVAWEAIANGTPMLLIHDRAGQGLPGYDPQWKNADPSFTKPWDSQVKQVEKLAVLSATETHSRLESYFENPTPALRNAIQTVYSMWRSSFSGLRPAIEYQPDGPNTYKVIGKIDNYTNATVTSVRALLTAAGCTLSGQGEMALSVNIGPKEKATTLPWRVETTDKLCRLNLAVIGSYPIPDLQYAVAERTFFPEQSKTEPVKPSQPRPPSGAVVAAPPQPSMPGGRWVLTAKPPFAKIFNPGAVQRVEQRNDGYRGIFYMRGEARELWGSFALPPAELQAGDTLRVEISTNYDMEVKLNAYAIPHYGAYTTVSRRAMNNGALTETARALQEVRMPPREVNRPDHKVTVNVEVSVSADWYAVWQYEYTWVP